MLYPLVVVVADAEDGEGTRHPKCTKRGNSGEFRENSKREKEKKTEGMKRNQRGGKDKGTENWEKASLLGVCKLGMGFVGGNG